MARLAIPDLWPADLGVGDGIPAPSAVLRQQGDKLGKRTRDAVFGVVESAYDAPSDRFLHRFVIEAPRVKVRQPVIEVRHGIKTYPAEVLLLNGGGFVVRSVADGVDDFVNTLREMFASPLLFGLIRSLIIQIAYQDYE